MNAPQFEIFAGVGVPKRAPLNSGAPRESQYPIDALEVGQMFLVDISGLEGQSTKSKDGTVTPLSLEEDTLRKARQKQSQLAALAKRRNVAIESRFIVDGGKLHESFAGRKNFVAVWRVEPKPETLAADPNVAPVAPEISL